MKIRWPRLTFPPINLWTAPHQPALEDTMTATAERDEVQDQLCARIDELERDKEVLAAQLDRAEERIDSLSKQANALHRIASTLDLWSQAGTNVSIDAVAEAAAKRVEELVSTAALAERFARAKGRHHSQHAMCDLMEHFGLPCNRPGE